MPLRQDPLHISPAPATAIICHCTHCQKASGSAFSVNLPVSVAEIRFEGEMAAYPDHGESGKLVNRRFCSTCGSSIGSEAEAFPGVFILKAGSLDDHSSIKPAMQVWTRSAQPWVKFAEPIPAVEKGR
jgi:hypothetical protein